MKLSIHSVEGIMNSLENLKVGMDLFNVTDQQRDEIEQQMARCSLCRKWKFNYDLKYGKCSCANQGNSFNDREYLRSGESKPMPTKAQKKFANKVLSDQDEEEFLEKIRTDERNSFYFETAYLSIRDGVLKGKYIKMAVQDSGLCEYEYYRVPDIYKKRLKDLKMAMTIKSKLEYYGSKT